jgi:CRP/FNR family transcriptional regulator
MASPNPSIMTPQNDWTLSFPPLQHLRPDELARLRDASQVLEMPAGSHVFGPGQAPRHFLLLLGGAVRVQQTSESGREIVLYRVRAGESCVLTTACLIGHEQYEAEGVAETPVRAALIPQAVFDELMAASGEFRRFVFTAFSRRVTGLFQVIEEVAFGRIDARLAQRLLDLADARGTSRPRTRRWPRNWAAPAKSSAASWANFSAGAGSEARAARLNCWIKRRGPGWGSVEEPLNNSPRVGAPGFGMGRPAQRPPRPGVMATISNEADRPNPGGARRGGVVQRFLT